LPLAPGVGLRIQIVQIAEGARGEEGVADIANDSFDATFSIVMGSSP